jgi:hypothetical protein
VRRAKLNYKRKLIVVVVIDLGYLVYSAIGTIKKLGITHIHVKRIKRKILN